MTTLKIPYFGGRVIHVPLNVYGVDTGSYEIEEFLAKGGNAIVLKCIQTSSGDEYAIKIQIQTQGNRSDRFHQERNIMMNIQHPHIIKYVDYGKVDIKDVPFRGRGKANSKNADFVIMELADYDLIYYLKQKDYKVSAQEYLGQIRGLASALKELHNIAIHRDIKPNNILVKGDRWFISDFGLCALNTEKAELTRLGENIGPKFWMSPEANNIGLGIDCEICKSSDVFQLASVFWLVINGKHPTGVLSQNDWNGPGFLFEAVYSSLAHSLDNRTTCGEDLYTKIVNSIESNLDVV